MPISPEVAKQKRGSDGFGRWLSSTTMLREPKRGQRQRLPSISRRPFVVEARAQHCSILSAVLAPGQAMIQSSPPRGYGLAAITLRARNARHPPTGITLLIALHMAGPISAVVKWP